MWAWKSEAQCEPHGDLQMECYAVQKQGDYSHLQHIAEMATPEQGELLSVGYCLVSSCNFVSQVSTEWKLKGTLC